MNLCLDGRRARTSDDWRSPHCWPSPPSIQSFRAFAPALAAEGADFPAESHDAPDRLQAASFWFRARNRLIVDRIRRYAPATGPLTEIGCARGFVLAGIQRADPVRRQPRDRRAATDRGRPDPGVSPREASASQRAAERPTNFMNAGASAPVWKSRSATVTPCSKGG
jgi:hypothetical protein